MWQGGGVQFLALKMSQNSIDEVLLDARDNSDRSTPATTNCNIEYSLESLRRGHRNLPFNVWANFSIGDSFHALATVGRSNFSTPSLVRCQYSVVASEIDFGRGSQCCQSGHEIHRIEGHLCRSIPLRCLQAVNHLAFGTQ